MDNIVSLTYFQQKKTVISVQSELLKKKWQVFKSPTVETDK